MLVQGIIKSIQTNSIKIAKQNGKVGAGESDQINATTASIRIPAFEASNKIEEFTQPDARFLLPSCIEGEYKEGDIVWVAFENNNINLPLILGKFCKNILNSDIVPSILSSTQANKNKILDTNIYPQPVKNEQIDTTYVNTALLNNFYNIKINSITQYDKAVIATGIDNYKQNENICGKMVVYNRKTKKNFTTDIYQLILDIDANIEFTSTQKYFKIILDDICSLPGGCKFWIDQQKSFIEITHKKTIQEDEKTIETADVVSVPMYYSNTNDGSWYSYIETTTYPANIILHTTINQMLRDSKPGVVTRLVVAIKYYKEA